MDANRAGITKLYLATTARDIAQKANQILLPRDMQQRPLARPLQIALGYADNIYSQAKTFVRIKIDDNNGLILFAKFFYLVRPCDGASKNSNGKKYISL